MTRKKIKEKIVWLRENEPDNLATLTRLRRALRAIDTAEEKKRSDVARRVEKHRAEEARTNRNKIYFVGII